MRVITAPEHYTKRPGRKSVFLAGGITNCPDWQQEFIQAVPHGPCKVDELKNLDVLNPRRANFDTSIQSETTTQIEWEFDMLQKVDAIVFWFPKETVCPITLYEFGFQLGKLYTKYPGADLFVGTDPEYVRRQDVIEQMSLVSRTKIKIETSLQQVAERVHVWYDFYDTF
jgi:hypothetical protein